MNTVHSFVSYLALGVGGFRPGDMLAALFFFALLLVLLRKFAWGPLMSMMEEREKFVANEIDHAEKSRKEAAIAAEEAKKQLQETRQEAQKIIDDAREAGVKLEQDIVESALIEAARLKEAAQADIQNEKEKAIQALQDQVASLSVLIASKVIEKELNTADQEHLINEYIKEVGEEQ